MTPTSEIESYDVSRGTAPLLRPRGFVGWLLIIVLNLACFVAINAFWHYLGCGKWFHYGDNAFRRDLVHPLGRTMLEPLKIFCYPWMVLVNGLLLAAVAFVPILMAVLHRGFVAVLFVAVVVLVGQTPALAAVLLLGCILASRTPLRSDMPFVAMMLGMVPVCIYTWFMGLSDVVSSAMVPLQRAVACAPFLIAFIVIVIGGAMVFLLARLTSYRPGVALPLLIALAAGSMASFYTQVGDDELAYALLVQDVEPGDAILKSVSVEEWQQMYAVGNLRSQELSQALDNQLQSDRNRLIDGCDGFIRRYPQSRHVPAVAWLSAQCRGILVDAKALTEGVVKYSARHPSLTPSSREAWIRLEESCFSSPQGAIAKWRLAQLDIRTLTGGDMSHEQIKKTLGRATRRLENAESHLLAIVKSRDLDRIYQGESIFLPLSGLPEDRYYPMALFEVRRMRWLIRANMILATWDQAQVSGDSKQKADAVRLVQALAQYVNLNANSVNYRKELSRLAVKYASTPLGDNLRLAHAEVISDPYKCAEALLPLAHAKPPVDASAPASFVLGILATDTANAAAVSLMKDLRKPQEYFKAVLAAKDNPWQVLARRRLEWLDALGPK